MNSIELGKLLKLTRRQRGLTQEQLAETLSVTTSAISKWENGKNLPDTDMLPKLALALNLPIEDLYYPEQKITQLTDKRNSIDNTVSDNIPYTESNRQKLNPFAFLFVICILLLLILGGIILHIYTSKPQALDITQIAYRTTEDESVGTVYEVACLYSGVLENDSVISEYISFMRNDWISNTSVPENIIYMKASFYCSEEAAYEWSTPDKSVYIVR